MRDAVDDTFVDMIEDAIGNAIENAIRTLLTMLLRTLLRTLENANYDDIDDTIEYAIDDAIGDTIEGGSGIAIKNEGLHIRFETRLPDSAASVKLWLPDNTCWLPDFTNVKTYSKTLVALSDNQGSTFWLPDSNKLLPRVTGYVKPLNAIQNGI